MPGSDYHASDDEYNRDLRKERAKRRSSKEDQDMTPERIINILENNKIFHHLYDPYYDQKDVRNDLAQTLVDTAASTNKQLLNPNSISFSMVMESLPLREQRRVLSEM